MFISGPAELGRQWLYFDRDRLIGVAIMDEIPQAVSLVYFFHDPEYLGYWIQQCPSMNYKNRFAPYEMLEDYVEEKDDPVWQLM